MTGQTKLGRATAARNMFHQELLLQQKQDYFATVLYKQIEKPKHAMS